MTTFITDGDGMDGWRANLDFEEGSAEIVEPLKHGGECPICEVHGLTVIEETPDEDAKLDPDAERTKMLLLLLSAKRMEKVLRYVMAGLEPREKDDAYADAEPAYWQKDHEMAREIEEVLDTLNPARFR